MAMLAMIAAALLPMLERAPAIDGRLDETEWLGAGRIELSGSCSGTVYFAQTEKDLVFAVKAKQRSREWRFATIRKHDANVYYDDSMDMFFSIPGRSGYRHVIANTAGTIYDAEVDSLRKADLSWESGARARGSYGDEDETMTIEVAVPVDVIAPPEGLVGICVCYFVKWCYFSNDCLGSGHKPETFTVFDLGRRFDRERRIPQHAEPPAMSAVAHSDILWDDEAPQVVVRTLGRQTGAPVRVSFKGDTATCTYLDKTKTIKFTREPSPWREEDGR